jgi:hypothetical protein
MPLYKSAQLLDVNDDFESFGDEDEVVLYDEKPSKDDVIEMHSPHEEAGMEISFKLPPLPGSEADIPIEVSTDDDLEVEHKGKGKDKNDLKEDLEVKDPSDYRSYSPKDLTKWVQYMFANIPRHSGRETTGIERCISYLKRFDGDLSRAISSDYKSEADIGKLEEARREVYNGIDRLDDALDKLSNSYKNKKKGNRTFGEIVKEAKQTHIGGIVITVPILISRIASVIINGMVSGGHSAEVIFDAQVKEYSLTKREQSELMELLTHMGYAMPYRDRGYPRDFKFDPTSSDNYDLSAQYAS